MRILFTQHALVSPGGSELFVCEVTSALHARGHQVAVYAGQIGELAQPLRQKGVLVVDDPRNCPWEPEIIHGQHRIHALKALIAFPRCPAILHLHGFLPALEKPFVHPRIRSYLVTSPWLTERWSANLGIPREKFETVLNHVDVDRFASVRQPPKRPASALFYGNTGTESDQLLLREVCGERGIALSTAGMVSGKYENRPEDLLPGFDLVFAVGRSALEASASGCGVLPVYRGMADEFLTTGNYARLRSQNMSVRLSKHQKLTKSWVHSQIDRWDPTDIMRVARQVRDDAGIERNVTQLEATYQRVIEKEKSMIPASLEEELECATLVLKKEMVAPLRHFRSQLALIEQSWSWRLTKPLRSLNGWVQRVPPRPRATRASNLARP